MARVRISLQGFADPVLRPRYIVWASVAVLVIAAVMVPVLGVTSTRWFCSNGCHKVQDDTIKAYQHSTHSEISCMACHMPVNANPVIFLMHKAEALGELAQTVTNNFELPLNGTDEVALTMSETQCTQCHDESKRRISPDPGLKINHQAHADNGVQCTLCHNRIAHNEDFELVLKNPKTKEPNQKHTNFMQMTACFRCHTQQAVGNDPPGRCGACHTSAFQLLPSSHTDPGFFPKGHGQLAAAEESRVAEVDGKLHKPYSSWLGGGAPSKENEKVNGEKEVGAKSEFVGEDLPTVDEVNLCSTCHRREFCTGCHGVQMPHPPDWNKGHGARGQAAPQVCQPCHGFKVNFCTSCHHGTTLNYVIDPKLTWKQQHPLAVNKAGASACFQCHAPTICARCHVNGGNLPKGATLP